MLERLRSSKLEALLAARDVEEESEFDDGLDEFDGGWTHLETIWKDKSS